MKLQNKSTQLEVGIYAPLPRAARPGQLRAGEPDAWSLDSRYLTVQTNPYCGLDPFLDPVWIL